MDRRLLIVADLSVDQIKILSRKLVPTPAWDLASTEVRVFLEGFGTMIERSEDEREVLRAHGDLVEPHWDAGLKRDVQARFRLYQRLHQCGLLTFRRRQKAKVGMFAVHKKGNKPGNSQNSGLPAGQCVDATSPYDSVGYTCATCRT